MRRYFVNNKEITKTEWTKAFQNNPEATVVLRVQNKPTTYLPPNDTDLPISPEKAKEIRQGLHKGNTAWEDHGYKG